MSLWIGNSSIGGARGREECVWLRVIIRDQGGRSRGGKEAVGGMERGEDSGRLELGLEVVGDKGVGAREDSGRLE